MLLKEKHKPLKMIAAVLLIQSIWLLLTVMQNVGSALMGNYFEPCSAKEVIEDAQIFLFSKLMFTVVGKKQNKKLLLLEVRDGVLGVSPTAAFECQEHKILQFFFLFFVMGNSLRHLTLVWPLHRLVHSCHSLSLNRCCAGRVWFLHSPALCHTTVARGPPPPEENGISATPQICDSVWVWAEVLEKQNSPAPFTFHHNRPPETLFLLMMLCTQCFFLCVCFFAPCFCLFDLYVTVLSVGQVCPCPEVSLRL